MNSHPLVRNYGTGWHSWPFYRWRLMDDFQALLSLCIGGWEAIVLLWLGVRIYISLSWSLCFILFHVSLSSIKQFEEDILFSFMCLYHYLQLKSTLSNLPIYYMSMMTISRGVVKKLEAIESQFPWGTWVTTVSTIWWLGVSLRNHFTSVVWAYFAGKWL